MGRVGGWVLETISMVAYIMYIHNIIDRDVNGPVLGSPDSTRA